MYFKAFVTNTFGIDSDVLHFKPQNRNDLKMKKTKKQTRQKKCSHLLPQHYFFLP